MIIRVPDAMLCWKDDGRNENAVEIGVANAGDSLKIALSATLRPIVKIALRWNAALCCRYDSPGGSLRARILRFGAARNCSGAESASGDSGLDSFKSPSKAGIREGGSRILPDSIRVRPKSGH